MAAAPPASDPWLACPFELEGLHPTVHSSEHYLNAKDPVKCHFLREATPPTLLGPHAASVSPTCPSGPPWNSSHVPPCRSSNVPPTLLTKSCWLCPEWPPPADICMAGSLHSSLCSNVTSSEGDVMPCPLIPDPPTYQSSVYPWPVFCVFTATSSVPRIRPCT